MARSRCARPDKRGKPARKSAAAGCGRGGSSSAVRASSSPHEGPTETFEEKLQRVLGERIAIVEYDPAWPGVYAAEVARLAAHFPAGSIRRIEHVGSTAVPGLAAKPIIDILVGVDGFGFVVDGVSSSMEQAGYDFFMRPELGDEGPRYPWFIGRDDSGARISHTHIALVGDVRQWDRVIFRDYLRSHPDAAIEYATLKRELADRLGDDREAYTLAKTGFITDAVAAARREGLTSASTWRSDTTAYSRADGTRGRPAGGAHAASGRQGGASDVTRR